MAETKRCSVDGCGRKVAGSGLCGSHRRRMRTYGDPLGGDPIRHYSTPGPRASTVAERFWAKVHVPSNPLDCWEWTAATSGGGYGVIQMAKGKRQYAHRLSYELSMGTIGQGLEIDHLCRNRVCVNPLHLQAVPASVNTRRRPDRSVTHCPQGHPYSGDNLYEYKGRRYCRTCQRERRQSAA